MNPVIIGNATLHLGDCIGVMAGLPENSLDSIICDPPYLINFMGRAFDSQHKSLPGANEGQKMQEWHRRWVTEAYRILKPGGHLAAFGGDRTHHRLMSAMEDVGFELRQCGYWVFSQGFPKSQNAEIAIEKSFGTLKNRSVGFNVAGKESGLGVIQRPELRSDHPEYKPYKSDHPLAKQYSGYGTALKPATEIIAIGRKPMIGTLAENLLEWGCGAMNLDACRVETDDNLNGGAYCNGTKDLSNASSYATGINIGEFKQPIGRFPPHLLHDGSDVVKKCFPDTTSGKPCGVKNASNNIYGQYGTGMDITGFGDSGSASRFFPSLPYDEEDCATIFYCAKASKSDRDDGCDRIQPKHGAEITGRSIDSAGLQMSDGKQNPYAGKASPINHNFHVSVKPTNLMRWICKLLTPKGGTLLDPFMGSGSTLKAAVLENFTCIGIEMDADYFAIAEARVAHVSPEVYVTPSRPERAEVAPRQQSMF